MKEHAPRLNDTYAVDRCAVCIATSALWYLQLGQIDAAIERCDYVAKHVLPTFDEGDTIGKSAPSKIRHGLVTDLNMDIAVYLDSSFDLNSNHDDTNVFRKVSHNNLCHKSIEME